MLNIILSLSLSLAQRSKMCTTDFTFVEWLFYVPRAILQMTNFQVLILTSKQCFRLIGLICLATTNIRYTSTGVTCESAFVRAHN